MKDYTYSLFKDRKEYSDVIPIPQDEHPRDIMKIAYSEQFVDCHDYLRAVMSSNELSERSLLLTTEALGLNAANFTTWAYRRNILEKLQYDFNKELDFVSGMIRENSKNYQVWYHRQWVLEKFSNDNIDELLESERDFIEDILDDDNKNYHAWQYFRWFVGKFPISKSVQLEFTQKLIDQDLLNNSAWNHRYYVYFDNKMGSIDEESLVDEIKFVKARILQSPCNDSSWNYLYGILNYDTKSSTESFLKTPSKHLDKIRDFIMQLENDPDLSQKCSQFMSFLVDFYVDEMCLLVGDNKTSNDEQVKKKAILCKAKVIDLCETLQCEVDKIRENYWLYRKKQIETIVI